MARNDNTKSRRPIMSSPVGLVRVGFVLQNSNSGPCRPCAFCQFTWAPRGSPDARDCEGSAALASRSAFVPWLPRLVLISRPNGSVRSVSVTTASSNALCASAWICFGLSVRGKDRGIMYVLSCSPCVVRLTLSAPVEVKHGTTHGET